MNRSIIAAFAIPLALGLSESAQGAEVSLDVVIHREIRPGVYGRIEIGGAPPPVVYAQPRIIVRQPPAAVAPTPVYLHVPPGHAKNWAKHCRKYNACSRPVYFVKSEEYSPGYKAKKPKKEKN